MQPFVISRLDFADDAVEIVERKGIGHPDTICDALAETLSRNLCQEYRRRCGQILHHNVDKALLCAGRAAPAFGAGDMLSPINIYLAGQAESRIGSEPIRIKDIAIEGSRSWMQSNLHALDVQRHTKIHALIQPGSLDLQDLFARRGQQAIALANDTSIGVGHAPLSKLERLVLAIEHDLNARDRDRDHPAWGEDIKVMAVRGGSTVQLTVACAMIGRYLAYMDDYLAEKAAIKRVVRELAAKHGFPACEIGVNIADDPASAAVYLTVTGTSAEAGDDGQVGRGNRVNGLITPTRPMSLEAAAGKNPVTHVGKIYNVLARGIAEALVAAIPDIAVAHCLMVSQIGAPITDPAIIQIKIAMHDAQPIEEVKARIQDIAAAGLARAPTLIDDFVAGTISIF